MYFMKKNFSVKMFFRFVFLIIDEKVFHHLMFALNKFLLRENFQSDFSIITPANQICITKSF